MRLRNTTDIPDYAIRRMTAWICKQLDYRVRGVKSLTVRNKTYGGYSGHAHPSTKAITCSIPPAREWRTVCEAKHWTFRDFPSQACRFDGQGATIDCMVELTGEEAVRERIKSKLLPLLAHEIAHLYLASIGSRTRVSRRYGGRVSRGGSERQTEWHERKVVEAFLPQANKLVDLWLAPPAERASQTAKSSVIELRAAKAAAALERWARKLKLAQTKLKKCKARIRYYEKSLAAKSNQSGANNVS